MKCKGTEENMRNLSHAFAFLMIAALLLTACGAEVVEVEVVVTPTPIPIGRELIREGLSGPEVVLDPAEWPTSYDDAPMLQQMVDEGDLPPVEERLPLEPLVLRPLNEIGQYGGIVRRGFTGPGDAWNPKRYGAHDHILF